MVPEERGEAQRKAAFQCNRHDGNTRRRGSYDLNYFYANKPITVISLCSIGETKKDFAIY